MIKIAHNQNFVLQLPEGHKFPIAKYNLVPSQLLSESTIKKENLFSPIVENREIVELTHTGEYVSKLLTDELTDKEIRKIGFPRSMELIEREFMIARGTREGAQYALKNGVAFNSAGGTHHAYADHGEGFCLLNDVACAANYLLNHEKINSILIVDLDVHQGNGTAKIFEHKERVFTFSMHGKSNYPLHKETSDLDIALSHGVTDDEYLEILRTTLPTLIHKTNPEIIFYVAGVDVLESDRWGQLNLTVGGCMERDRYVFEMAHKNNIPIMVTMGGGYSPDINIIMEAHCNTYRAAFQIFQ